MEGLPRLLNEHPQVVQPVLLLHYALFYRQRFAAPPTADALVETLTDLYGTARDEFEIAAEETEKKTVYAADDRAAAREAFEELQSTYEGSLKEATPETAQEVQRRVGQRVRELEHALKGLEESALHDD